MKVTKKISSILLVAMLISLIAMSTVPVLAADPIVIDFSKNDFIMGAIGGQGDMNVINDGDKRVLFAECTDGYDPDVDPDSTQGDLYATVEDFASFNLDGSKYKWMKTSIKNESAAPHFEIHFSVQDVKGYSVDTSINFDINPNSGYTDYVWNVEEFSEKYYPKRPADVDDPDNWPNFWKQGMIDGFRLDFMYYDESGGHARTGDKIYIEYIAFFETEAEATAFTFTPERTPASIAEAKAIADAEKEAAAAAAAEEAAAAAEEAAANAENEAADDADANSADESDNSNDTTSAPTSSSNNSDTDDGNGMVMWIIIAIAVVAIIVVIFVLVSKKK